MQANNELALTWMDSRPLIMKPSLARFSIALFAALEITLILTMLSVYWVSSPARHAESAQAEGLVIAQQIEGLAKDVHQTAKLIARHPQTVACLKSGAEDLCRNQAANLYALHQGAQIFLVPEPGVVSQTGDASVLPEAYTRFVAGPEAQPATAASMSLTVSEPVLEGTTLLGHVILTQDAPHLQDLFDNLPLPGGYLELRQYTHPDTYTVVRRRGDESLKSGPAVREITLAGTPWKLELWKASPQPLVELLTYFTVWLVLSVLLTAMVWLVYLRLRNWVSEDLNTIVNLMTDIRRQRVRSTYQVNLTEFEKPLAMLVKLAQLTVGKQKETESQASLDHLSQVYNRRSFETRQSELFKTLSQGQVHSLLIIDIDNFKYVNDTYGHDAGDQLIVQFGKVLKLHLRASDFVARLGGDEFCVIFPNTPLPRAIELAERLRGNLPAVLELTPGVLHRLNWSGGMSEYSPKDSAENQALIRADGALLEAKRGGRNTTRIKPAA